MERALLVTVDFGARIAWTAPERSLELGELARSAGVKVMREEIVRRHEPNSASFIGSGKAEEIAAIRASENIDVVIFNNDLTGTQQKNIEDAIGTKVIDRTQLILDIFARRARSNEGKLQVELAQLMYLLPRLTGKGVYLSRLGGGIGTRGPGEQKLEVDRRRIRQRIFHLESGLNDLRSRRAMMRKNRSRFSLLTVALIGYTNTGKSTLLNALTDSKVIVQDKLFSTLDPTVRKFTLPNRQNILFVDTVGFLSDLPHHLIEAFKATLEEVVEADLLVHLVDASHPKAREASEVVLKVLEELGAKDKPVITALNKIDKISESALIERMKTYFHDAVPISALKREGFDVLIDRISAHVNKFISSVRVTVPAGNARILGLIYENGIIHKKEYTGSSVLIEAELPIRVKEMVERELRALEGKKS